MERSNNNSNTLIRKQNKGFTVHVGEEYVGHFVINEDRVAPETIANLQKPEIMKSVLAEAELRAFVSEADRPKRDTSAIDAIIGKATAPAPADDADTDAELAEILKEEQTA